MLTKILDDMLAANAAPEMIVLVAKGIIEKMEAESSARREKNRQRMQAARSGEEDLCAHVRAHRAHEKTIESKKDSKTQIQSKRERKTLLEVDWQLPEEGIAYAKSRGWTIERIQSEAQRFRDHARANGRKQIDWPAAWRNWVTSPYQKPVALVSSSARAGAATISDIRTMRKERVTHALDKLADFASTTHRQSVSSGADQATVVGFPEPRLSRS